MTRRDQNEREKGCVLGRGLEWGRDAYLEPVCLHGVISKAVSEEAN